MKVSTENDNNFGYEKNYDCGRQYPFNINDKFSSYEELLVFKGNYEKYNFIQLYTRTSQTLDYFLKRNPSRKVLVNLKYSRIELACIHGGKKLFPRQVEKDQTPGIRKFWIISYYNSFYI